jgi:hypothetical protein
MIGIDFLVFPILSFILTSIAETRGRSPLGYFVLLTGLWFGCEGFALWAASGLVSDVTNQREAVVFFGSGLLGAIIGGIIPFVLILRLPPAAPIGFVGVIGRSRPDPGDYQRHFNSAASGAESEQVVALPGVTYQE